MLADGLSTGVFILGGDKGMALIEKLPDVEGVIVTADNGAGLVGWSSGLKGRAQPHVVAALDRCLHSPTDAPGCRLFRMMIRWCGHFFVSA